MHAYLAIFSARFRMALQYRAAAIAGLATQIFFGFVRVMIYDAFYRSSPAAQPMSYPHVVSYVWLGQAMLLLVMFGPEAELAAMIRTGTVAYELTRPTDLYALWFSRTLSGRLAPLLMRSIPILLLSAAFFGLEPPASSAAAGLFVLSFIAGLLLSASMVMLITITLLWTISGEGVARLAPAIIFFLSGIVIPLPLFPDWMQPALNALPFRGLIDVPFRVYLGDLAGREALAAIVLQVIWTAAFIALGRWLLARGLGRLVVQGG